MRFAYGCPSHIVKFKVFPLAHPHTLSHTLKVCEDVQSILRIQGAEVFKMSVNRPNLYYEVWNLYDDV